MTVRNPFSLRCLALGTLVAAAAAVTFAPSPAMAWWVRGGVVLGPPIVVAPPLYAPAPPVVYAPPPRVYGPPVVVYPRPYARWIPGHYDYRGSWVRGHYA